MGDSREEVSPGFHFLTGVKESDFSGEEKGLLP